MVLPMAYVHSFLWLSSIPLHICMSTLSLNEREGTAVASLMEEVVGGKRAQTYLSLQNTAERFASVIEKTFTRSSFTKEEISTLATVLLKSVESTTLASFLKPSANVSQTIQTEYLGRIFLSWQGPTWGLI